MIDRFQKMSNVEIYKPPLGIDDERFKVLFAQLSNLDNHNELCTLTKSNKNKLFNLIESNKNYSNLIESNNNYSNINKPNNNYSNLTESNNNYFSNNTDSKKNKHSPNQDSKNATHTNYRNLQKKAMLLKKLHNRVCPLYIHLYRVDVTEKNAIFKKRFISSPLPPYFEKMVKKLKRRHNS